MPSQNHDPGRQDYESSNSINRPLPNSVDDLVERSKKGLNTKKILSFYRKQLDKYKFTDSELEAEDVFAEAWMRTYLILLRENKNITNWDSWFIGVGKNIILENLRKKKQQHKFNILESNSVEDAPSEWDRHLNLEEEQEKDIILRCLLNPLSHDDMSLLILRFQDGLSWKQISDIYPGTTEAALRKRCSRLIQEFRKRTNKD